VLLPILRILNIQRELPWIKYVTATSGLQLVWFFFSVNRGMQAPRESMRRRGFAYAIALTLIVVFAGAAGMFYFESPIKESNITSFSVALYFAAMQITTIGSQYAPVTLEGEIICLGISIFACAMFGYLTAILATFFIGRDAADPGAELAGQSYVARLEKVDCR